MARTYIGPMEMRPEQDQLRVIMLDIWQDNKEYIKEMYYHNLFGRKSEEDKIKIVSFVKELVESFLWENTVKRL